MNTTDIITYTDFEKYATTSCRIFVATTQNAQYLVPDFRMKFTRTTNLRTFLAIRTLRILEITRYLYVTFQRLLQNKNSSGTQRKAPALWEGQTPQLAKEWKREHRKTVQEGQGDLEV